jgi:hypothetical protein
MARREFLQLAKTFKKDKPKMTLAGRLISEKLDGTRCFWDGGISRGVPTVDVPYSSLINPKNGLRKEKVKPFATGLWSRYGNPIMAPDEFLDQLPPTFLDGELWAGRGNFQLCRSICGGDRPDPRFMDQIQFACYSSPGITNVFADGEIKNSNFHRTINRAKCEAYVTERLAKSGIVLVTTQEGGTFADEMSHMLQLMDLGPKGLCFVHRQEGLSDDEQEARDEANAFMDAALAVDAEGAIIREPGGIWTPKRVNDLYKFKPWDDDEGIITGFTSGRRTSKGSKYLGMIGALILDYKGQRLELSGLNLKERVFEDAKAVAWARENDGKDMPSGTQGKHFKVGQQVTFKYRELSDDGIPKEARYWRKRDVE